MLQPAVPMRMRDMANLIRGVMSSVEADQLPVLDWAEDVMGFEEPGEEEENGHGAGGPGEDEQRQGLGEGGVRGWRCFAEDHATDEGDGGGNSEQEERAEDAINKGVVGLKEELRVFDREEKTVEDKVDGEQAEEKSCELGELLQRALKDFERGQLLAVLALRLFPLAAAGSDEGEAVEGDPRLLEAIPYGVGHSVLTHGAEQGCEGWISSGLFFDVRDDVFAVETEELFYGAAG